MNLSSDIFKKVFTIKAKVHGYLKNLTDHTLEEFNTTCKITNNKYIYHNQETTYTIKLDEETVIFTRENADMSHTMLFSLKKITTSEYYLKEFNNSLEFNIKTTNLEMTDNKFIINYQVLETNNEYEYIIEMSDIK